ITLAEPFNDVYQTPAHTKKVFTNMKRKGKDFSGRVTPLFASMLAPPVVEGKGSEDTQFPQTSVPIPNVTNEAVFKEWDDRVVRATTIAASLDVVQASGNIYKTQSTTMSNDPLSQEIGSGGNTPRSDEERIKQDDLMDFVPPTPHNLPLSGGHTPGSDEDLVMRKMKKKVGKLEKKLRARTPGIKLFKIGTSKKKSLDEEYVSKQGRKSDKTKPVFDDSDFVKLDVDNAMKNVESDAETQGRNTVEQITTNGDTVNTASIDVSAVGPLNVSTDPSTSTAGDIFEDEMMTIADTLVAIRSTRPRTTSVVIRDVEDEQRRATPVPTIQSQDKEFDNVQARIEEDALLAARLQEKEREQFSIDEQARVLVETIAERKRIRIQKLYEKEQKWIKDFIPMDSREGGKKAASSKKRPRAEPDEESVKRQKIRETSGSGEEQSVEKEKELSEEELHKLLVVVPVEEVYVEALQVKYPIIDWEVYSEDTRRDDLVKLWDLVKKRFSTTEPTDDKEKELWVELKRLGHDIFMLVKKEYPLTRGTLGLIMVARLLVEADSEMSRELLRKIFYQANKPRQVMGLTDYNHLAKGWFRRKALEGMYQELVYPLGEVSSWQRPNYLQVVKAPLMDKKPTGRPKSTARIRSQGEEPVPVRCGRCGARGHNQNSYRETIPQKKAKTSATGYSQQEHYYSQQEHYYSQQAMPFSFEAVNLNDP
ncbi:hypothetical protein Tco_1385316, partial [Tanacetum coccineum]